MIFFISSSVGIKTVLLFWLSAFPYLSTYIFDVNILRMSSRPIILYILVSPEAFAFIKLDYFIIKYRSRQQTSKKWKLLQVKYYSL
jgi:hypothetical protein